VTGLQAVVGDDAAAELDRLAEAMRAALRDPLRRKGYVIAVSGGVDSAACAALAVRAVGPGRVHLLALPERESDPASLALARALAASLGVPLEVEDIAPALEALGCYARRDAAIRRVVPGYGAGWACKLALARAYAADALGVTRVVVRSPDGDEQRVRLGPVEYRAIVAASNFKQRVRTMLTYHAADARHYAVVGTPNRLEYALGFFVKGGDGLADVKPIAHLYKGEVHRLARSLGVPEAILQRPSTTDTFSLPQTQEEFYFSYPLLTLDRLVAAYDARQSAEATAHALGLAVDEVRAAFADIARKAAVAASLHATGLTFGDRATGWGHAAGPAFPLGMPGNTATAGLG